MQIRAIARDIGIPPRKMRLVTNAVKGKSVIDALAILQFLPNAGAQPVSKVVASAAANAENNLQMSPTELRVVEIFINQGPTLKRVRPQARGRVNPILRHSSHIIAVVGTEE